MILIPLSAQAFLDDLFDDLEGLIEQSNSESTTNNVKVINKVNVTAETGGNSVNSGEEVKGSSEVKVKVETVINDEPVEPINIEVKSEDEEASVKVEQKVVVPDEETEPVVEQEIEINKENNSLENNSQESKINYTKLSNKFFQWWSSFFSALKKKLASVVGFWRK